MVAEYSASGFQEKDSAMFSLIQTAKPGAYQQGENQYTLTDNGIVQITQGHQAADGIFITCKNTILDLWLPLIGYLTFFCGLLHFVE